MACERCGNPDYDPMKNGMWPFCELCRVCDSCHGTGVELKKGMERCPRCLGKGWESDVISRKKEIVTI